MNIVVILVHGYNVTDPRNTVGKFRKYFEQLNCLVENYVYGYWPLPIQITRRNPALAAELAARCKYWKRKGCQVWLAVHSNGAAITRLAVEVHGAHVDRLLAMHPALRRDLDPAKTAEKILVVHNGGDGAVRVGGILNWIAKFIMPASWAARPWGEMGRSGYNGAPDPRIKNINTGDPEKFNPTAWGHSDEFARKKESYFLPLLITELFESP